MDNSFAKMLGFFYSVYRSFVRTGGFVLTALGAVFSALTFYYLPSKTFSIQVCLPIWSCGLILLVTLSDLSIRCYMDRGHRLPKVAKIGPPLALDSASLAWMLLSTSDLLSFGQQVSIYRLENGFEALIGVGYVLAKQEDGLLQVVVTQEYGPDGTSLWTTLQTADAPEMARLIVKPGGQAPLR